MGLGAVAVLLAALDLGPLFANRETWQESSVDFTVERAEAGFKFASQKRDIVNCMRRGACTWYGLDVWEARVYFGTEGIGKVELSLYNRGDDRQGDGLSVKAFGRMQERIALALGSSKPERPSKRKLRAGGFQFEQVWPRADPAAELDWGVSGGDVEFVRLTLRPRERARPRGTGKPVEGQKVRAKVKANVTKNAEGDVWIRNVPMVDQGQKGYCAAAVAERVLRYYGHDIDEHEIAQMAGTTAEGGTSSAAMAETVRAIGSKCRLGYGVLVSLAGSFGDLEQEVEQYNRAAKAMGEPELDLQAFIRGNTVMVGELRDAMKAKVLKRMRVKDGRFKKFLAGVRAQVDQGVPVFWSVTLGYFPEPGLPQTHGGHMRLIIGYNARTKEILYTDTWGAGHELKRMPEDWAFAISNTAFTLRPL